MSNSYINRFNITQLHKYRILVIDGYFAILFFNPLLSFISMLDDAIFSLVSRSKCSLYTLH